MAEQVAKARERSHAPLTLVFSRTEKRARIWEARLVATVTLAAVVALLAAGQLLAGWLGAVMVARGLRLLLLLVVGGGALAFALRQPQRFFASRALPRLLRLNETGQRSAVESAASFLRAPAHASPMLVEAHLAETTARLTPQFSDARLAALFRPLDKRARLSLAIGLAVLALSVLAAPGQMQSLLSALFSAEAAELSSLPLVGDLTLTLRAPAYTGLDARLVRGGDGSVRALKGTEVVLRAMTDRPVRSAELHIGEGATQRIVPLAVRDGRELGGEFAVTQSERYRFVLKPFLGSAQKERFGHPIYAEDDKPPQIELRQPATDLELKESGRVTFNYVAGDDFGIAELALVYRNGSAAPEHIALPLPESRTKIRGDYAFDLSPLKLKAGDVVTVQLEAKDNNTVSGPGKAQSASRRITIYSAEAHRRELLDRLREITDRLVDILADELENSPTDLKTYGAHALPNDDRALAVATDLLSIAQGLNETDQRSKVTFSVAADRTGRELQTQYVKKRATDQVLAQGGSSQMALNVRGDAIRLLERTIIYFEDLRGLATIEELKSQAEELVKTGAELRELLQKYRETGDETLRKTLESEIQSLKHKLDEIRSKMAELRQNLPEGYANKEALARHSLDNTLEKLDDLLAQNKFDELQNELEHLQNELSQFEKQVDQAQDEYGGDAYAELRKKVNAFSQNFDALEQAQKQTLEDTQKSEDSYRKEVQKRVGENLEQLIKDSMADIENAERELDKPDSDGKPGTEAEERGRVSQRLQDARSALQAHDLLEARDMLALGERDLDSVQSMLRQRDRMSNLHIFPAEQSKEIAARVKSTAAAAADTKRALDRLNKLFPDPKDVLSPKEQQQLSELQHRQDEIAKRERQLSEQMKQLNQEAPMFDPSAMQEMSGAGEAMDRASGELKQSQAGKATQGQQSALERLQKIKDSMKRQGGQGQGQSGIPQPFGGMPQPFGNDDGQGGNQQDKVEIPNGDEFKVPKEFRRDILDAMKQGSPEKFKKQVEQFYRELIK